MAKLGLGQTRRFARVFLQTMDPEQAAAAVGAKDGIALLSQPEVAEQVDAQRKLLDSQFKAQDVIRAMAMLAFGRSNDCVKLALEPSPDVEKLDLRLLSEIRRNEKGTVEIRLVDRLEVLEQLQTLCGGSDTGAAEFLAAMTEPGENG